jgi:hypothetical protein
LLKNQKEAKRLPPPREDNNSRLKVKACLPYFPPTKIRHFLHPPWKGLLKHEPSSTLASPDFVSPNVIFVPKLSPYILFGHGITEFLIVVFLWNPGKICSGYSRIRKINALL